MLDRACESQSQLSIDRGQPGWMGVVATPKCKMVAYWVYRDRKEFGGFDQELFDHHTCVGYNAANVFY